MCAGITTGITLLLYSLKVLSKPICCRFEPNIEVMSLKNKKHKKICFIENEFKKISNSIKDLKLDPNSIRKLKSIEKLIDLSKEKTSNKERNKFYLLAFVVLILSLFYSGIYTRQGFTKFWFWWKDIHDWEDTYCTLSMPVPIQNALIPRFDCNLCAQLKNVSKVSNLSPEEFTQRQVFYYYKNLSLFGNPGPNNYQVN